METSDKTSDSRQPFGVSVDRENDDVPSFTKDKNSTMPPNETLGSLVAQGLWQEAGLQKLRVKKLRVKKVLGPHS
jgi:hypothetical protein